MPAKVNIDALISREDFEVRDPPVQFQAVQTIQIRDLEPEGFFYQLLRKPDFQRETADWTPERICDFVQSFLNGDLIPGIIFWNSGSHIFVIDGAHRLSALIAWVQDDYGDGPASRAFFEQRIAPEQIDAAENTRRLIKSKIDDYRTHKYAVLHPDKTKTEILERARRMATLAIQVQWVVGKADKAESSFFKINQQAVAIDKTELRLLEARKKPNAMAARAIIHSGRGHRYWDKFDQSKQQEIQSLAESINDTLFTPWLKTPIKTLDLPIAGQGYSPQTLQLVFDLVNFVNSVKSDKEIQIDTDGSLTINFLKNTRKTVNRIGGIHASSLGMHPVVYFYGANGRYQPTAFMAIVGLLKDFEMRNYYRTFTKHRKDFEDFIIKYKDFANQVATVRGSGTKGMKPLQTIYQTILDGITEGRDEQEILDVLLKDSRFPFLKLDEAKKVLYGRDFDTETKSEVFIRNTLKDALKCGICGGFIGSQSISYDHITRKEDGGLGSPDNAQPTHPYCNTTYKN